MSIYARVYTREDNRISIIMHSLSIGLNILNADKPENNWRAPANFTVLELTISPMHQQQHAVSPTKYEESRNEQIYTSRFRIFKTWAIK